MKLTHLAHSPGLKSFSTVNHSAKVLFEYHTKSVFEFKLNAPKNLNSLDLEMVDLMLKKVKQWDEKPDQAPRIALISGVGEKAFCAGGDIKHIYESGTGKADPNIKADFFAREYLLDYALTQMKPKQISIWNGIVMGGGVGVSVHAPIRVATDSTVYAMPETGIGFFTDVGGSYFLSRVKNNISLGLYLGLTGHRLKSRDLVKWGIATHFVPKDKLPELYTDLTQHVKKDSSDQHILAIVNAHSDLSAQNDIIDHLDEINATFQNDSIDNIIRRLEEHQSDFSKKTLKHMAGLSPLSMAVVFEQIKRGAKMNLKEVFQMEYKISQGFVNHTEFFEGVRALLIDKDKNPKWKHTSVHQIKKEEVDFFFDRPETLNLEISQQKISTV